MTTYLL
jgi:gas vesicle protein